MTAWGPIVDIEEIEKRLAHTDSWTLKDKSQLTKTFTFSDFAEAWKWLNKVAEVAEELDHHPDIFVHWNTVVLNIYSHDVQRITSRDFRLVKAIDELDA
ncbi:MAG: 4a-hydroxytetrahydrobiopterin dehydratase [Corynebacteriales bacterium]|nr:4a-hydroxytetrahydrobiopterin dehydratase [Mycobacteriales bacterium]